MCQFGLRSAHNVASLVNKGIITAMSKSEVLNRLASTFEERKQADPSSSYVAALLAGGEDAILKKVGEESTEFILAAKGDDNTHLVAEAADVWFHMLVLLSQKGLGPDDILNELNRREGVSGLDEKASRAKV